MERIDMASFAVFFAAATGSPPYGYQARLARDGLPAVVQAPTGTGKTGIVLAWLWRRLPRPSPACPPRRMFFPLPQRMLEEPGDRPETRRMSRLGLAGEDSPKLLLGG